MAVKYGLDFPFRTSLEGLYLRMTTTNEREVRANLIHLLLTRKGSRYFLPDFGTRIYEYIFDQNDAVTWALIEEEIRNSVRTYIPNLDIQDITVAAADEIDTQNVTFAHLEDERLFRVSDHTNDRYTAKVKISYNVNNGTFSSSDFVIINI